MQWISLCVFYNNYSEEHPNTKWTRIQLTGHRVLLSSGVLLQEERKQRERDLVGSIFSQWDSSVDSSRAGPAANVSQFFHTVHITFWGKWCSTNLDHSPLYPTFPHCPTSLYYPPLYSVCNMFHYVQIINIISHCAPLVSTIPMQSRIQAGEADPFPTANMVQKCSFFLILPSEGEERKPATLCICVE